MGRSQGTATTWLLRSAAIAALAVGLAACGEMPDKGTVVTPSSDAAPSSGETTELTHRAEASIVDGKLEPNLFADKSGTAFELVVTGDGKEHTLAIDQLVDGETVAASGATTIGFTIDGEPGKLDITLDGASAGTFEVQAP